MESNNKKNRKGLYQAFGIVLLCLSLIALTYNITFAWFRDSSVTSNEPNVTIVGTIALDVTTNFKFTNLTFAPDTTYTVDSNGDSIATKIKTAEEHDIDGAFVRLKWTTNRSEITLHFGDNLTTSSDYTGTSDENNWYYNSSDGFYYYIGIVKDTDVTFNEGYYVDNTLHNAKAGAPVEMSFYVEGLQSQYGAYLAEWTTAPKIFNTYARQKMGY